MTPPPEVVALRAQVAELRRQCAELRAWKAEATPLLASVNEQLAADGNLGESYIRDVLPRVLRERNALRERLQADG